MVLSFFAAWDRSPEEGMDVPDKGKPAQEPQRPTVLVSGSSHTWMNTESLIPGKTG